MTASLPRQARFLEVPINKSTLRPCVLFAIARAEAGFARRAQQLIIEKIGKNMEIIHQLPGRVRIRIPELESKDYCQRVVEESANDDRIKDLRISPACISLTVCYDPIQMEIKDVLDLLGEEKPIKQPVAQKKPGLVNKKAKAAGAKSGVRATAKMEKGQPAEPGKNTKVHKKRPVTGKYFKPAVSTSVQEKIRQIIKSEDPKKPYSDGKISGLLKEEDIEIARRTVAKYREIMGILPSSKRKK